MCNLQLVYGLVYDKTIYFNFGYFSIIGSSFELFSPYLVVHSFTTKVQLCENVRLGFYFADLIFVVCQSTAKTAKIGSLKIFRLYGMFNYVTITRGMNSF